MLYVSLFLVSFNALTLIRTQEFDEESFDRARDIPHELTKEELQEALDLLETQIECNQELLDAIEKQIEDNEHKPESDQKS